MRDVRVAELAKRQFNRVSRRQLLELGLGRKAILRWVQTGRLVIVEQGVFALAPILEHDEWGTWMGATLTAPETFLSHLSCTAARGLWGVERPFETVTRPGNGGPRRHGGLLVYRSTIVKEDIEVFRGIPMTTVPRAVLDNARGLSQPALARMVREAVRLKRTSVVELGDAIARHPRRRGVRQLARVLARYTGLPLERARSGAEIRAMEILRDAGRPLPELNVHIAGEEADLSWPDARLIIEIDGSPFHLDVGEDARKKARWERAGWKVRRIPADRVYEAPHLLLAQSPTHERP